MEKPPDGAALSADAVRPDPDPKNTPLRLQAEKQVLAAAALLPEYEVPQSPEAARLMLHELRVHQIELEMQNEELRRAQVELEAARMRYFDLYDLAPVGYCTVDAHGLVLQANLAAATLLGLSRTALATRRISAVIFHADQDIYYLCRKQVLATGDLQTCELRMVKSDGVPFWVQLAVSAAANDGQEIEPGMRIVITDISERQLMQTAMKEREARYRAMVEWLPEPLLVQRHGIIIYVNPATLKLFGTSHSLDLIGRPADERIHPDFLPLAHAQVHAMVREKTAVPMSEMVLLKLDGTAVHVEVQSMPTDFDGAPAIQSVMHDITERVRLGQMLQAKNADLEAARSVADKANRAKSDFLSGMSHELRTPLGTILGYAQLLESGTPPPSPQQQRNIDQILRAGWYLLKMVNEVLDLATIESGKLSLVLEPVAVAGIMRDCQAMVEPLASRREVSITFPDPGAPLRVQADQMRLKQVLINLLSNAIKYNKVGGSVTMRCQVHTPERLRICITDTGQGLSPEAVEQLFQPFNRLGQERSTEEGTGIGLAMCERLVQLMGGAIGVHSRAGEGSVFWVELNLLAQADAALTGGSA